MLDIFGRRQSEISTLDLEIGFRQFAITEERCWNIARDPRTFVRPSGRLTALLAVHLNFPSYTTRNAFDGETADVTLACPRLLICAGLSSENSFWFNTYSRREVAENRKAMNPAKEYPDAALQTHQDWSLLLRENMQARVEVVFGVANEKQMKIALGPLLEEFILWDKQETTLHIEFTNVQRIVVRRIIIFVPQHLYHDYQISAANKIDAQLEVATAIAEVSRTEEQSRYFRYIRAREITENRQRR
jgi:hypothetical protein